MSWLKAVATLGLKVAVPYVAEKLFRRKPKEKQTIEMALLGVATQEAIRALVDSVPSDEQTETERLVRSIVGQLPNNSRSEMDLSAILPLAQTLLNSLTGGKSAALVSGAEDEFRAASNAAIQASEVFDACADAVSDGTVTWDELQRILAEAKDVPAAIKAIKGPADPS